MQKNRALVRSLIVPFTLLFAALLFAACSETSSSVRSSTGTGTGSIGVFLTDAPSDDFDEINVTITKIELIGSGGRIVVFEGSETVDLKDLENFSDLFVFAEEVPTGHYHKIRLTVNEVELVREEGGVMESVLAKLPGHGKIDLLARGGFVIEEGEALMIELDIDARRSIHVHPTGKGDYRFRPVVFVTVLADATPSKLARVHGVITGIDDAAGSFELCSTVFMAAKPAPTGVSKPVNKGTGDVHRCVVVHTDDATSVFDDQGDPAVFADLVADDEVTVVGHYARVLIERDGTRKRDHADSDSHADSHAADSHDSHADSHDDSDGDSDRDRPEFDIELDAIVIEMGPAGTFRRLAGVTETDLDPATDEFDFAIAPGQGFGGSSSVTTALQAGTRVFSKTGEEVADDEIVADTAASIDGVLELTTTSSRLKAALVVLDIEFDAADAVRGPIVSTDEATRTLELDVDGKTVCVDVAVDAEIYVVTEHADGATSERATFEDLVVDMVVDAYGPMGTTCVEATTVIGFVDAPGDV